MFTYSDGTTTSLGGGGTYGQYTIFCQVDNDAVSNRCYGQCNACFYNLLSKNDLSL